MVTPKRSIVAALCALALLCGSLACDSETPTTRPPAAERGTVVSSTPVAGLSSEQASALLTEQHADVRASNAVDAFRVEYRTIDPQGAQTTATGLLALPRDANHRLRVVVYEHGTMSVRTDAPSVTDGGEERARAMMFAAAGYAAIAPDYLGLGGGPGSHPFAHTPSEVSASVDLLSAAREFTEQQQRELDPEVLVTGFSQGGQAAMGFAKALQEGKAPGFGLAAAAPVSGPFDIQGVELPAAFDGRIRPASAVFYVAYWLTAMNRIYHLYDTPRDAFQEPSATKVEQLFDGTHGELSVALALAPTPQRLVTPVFADLATHPTGPVLRAMTDSDTTCDWSPRVPIHLYAASGDRDVAYANSERCMRDLRDADGPEAAAPPADRTLTDLGDLDHTASARTAMPRIMTWFQQLAPTH